MQFGSSELKAYADKHNRICGACKKNGDCIFQKHNRPSKCWLLSEKV